MYNICDTLISDSNIGHAAVSRCLQFINVYCKFKSRELMSTFTHKHKSYIQQPPPRAPHTHKQVNTDSFNMFLRLFFSQYISFFDAANKNQKGVLLVCVFVCIHVACVLVLVRAYVHPPNPRPPPTWWNVSDWGLPTFKPHLLFTRCPSLSLAPHTIIPFPTAPAQEIADLFCIATMNFKWVLLKESSQPLL